MFLQIASLVASLLAHGCPSAVVGGVRSIVVDPIQRVLIARTPAHVTKESLEGCIPLGADGDPASSVVLEVGGRRRVTAIPHVCPDSKFRTDPTNASVPVPCGQRAHSLSTFIELQTPTALGVIPSQFTSRSDAGVPAITPAEPSNKSDHATRAGSGAIGGTADYNESAKTLSSEIQRRSRPSTSASASRKEFKVRRIHTDAISANVIEREQGSNRTAQQFPTNAMRQSNVSYAVLHRLKLAVAMTAARCCPRPAPASALSINFRPKSRDLNWSHAPILLLPVTGSKSFYTVSGGHLPLTRQALVDVGAAIKATH